MIFHVLSHLLCVLLQVRQNPLKYAHEPSILYDCVTLVKISDNMIVCTMQYNLMTNYIIAHTDHLCVHQTRSGPAHTC